SLTAAIKDGTTDSIYVHGKLVASAGGKLATIAGCQPTGNVGRGYNDNTYYAGDVAEVLVYNRALTEMERQGLEQLLGNKYGLPTPPAITQQPAAVPVAKGGSATLSVTASGSAPLAYQWWFNGTAVSGALSSTYTINDVQPAHAGNYQVVVTN